jgi:hypothetical protein
MITDATLFNLLSYIERLFFTFSMIPVLYMAYTIFHKQANRITVYVRMCLIIFFLLTFALIFFRVAVLYNMKLLNLYGVH